mmetsp:Transcript_28268/g.91439  ORF Transcript_28268/g.91439 Transcript_28268/m.91439 type:complete len:318 (-) Transcript_28268:263-1216(-)
MAFASSLLGASCSPSSPPVAPVDDAIRCCTRCRRNAPMLSSFSRMMARTRSMISSSADRRPRSRAKAPSWSAQECEMDSYISFFGPNLALACFTCSRHVVRATARPASRALAPSRRARSSLSCSSTAPSECCCASSTLSQSSTSPRCSFRNSSIDDCRCARSWDSRSVTTPTSSPSNPCRAACTMAPALEDARDATSSSDVYCACSASTIAFCCFTWSMISTMRSTAVRASPCCDVFSSSFWCASSRLANVASTSPSRRDFSTSSFSISRDASSTSARSLAEPSSSQSRSVAITASSSSTSRFRPPSFALQSAAKGS